MTFQRAQLLGRPRNVQVQGDGTWPAPPGKGFVSCPNCGGRNWLLIADEASKALERAVCRRCAEVEYPIREPKREELER